MSGARERSPAAGASGRAPITGPLRQQEFGGDGFPLFPPRCGAQRAAVEALMADWARIRTSPDAAPTGMIMLPSDILRIWGALPAVPPAAVHRPSPSPVIAAAPDTAARSSPATEKAPRYLAGDPLVPTGLGDGAPNPPAIGVAGARSDIVLEGPPVSLDLGPVPVLVDCSDPEVQCTPPPPPPVMLLDNGFEAQSAQVPEPAGHGHPAKSDLLGNTGDLGAGMQEVVSKPRCSRRRSRHRRRRRPRWRRGRGRERAATRPSHTLTDGKQRVVGRPAAGAVGVSNSSFVSGQPLP